MIARQYGPSEEVPPTEKKCVQKVNYCCCRKRASVYELCVYQCDI